MIVYRGIKEIVGLADQASRAVTSQASFEARSTILASLKGESRVVELIIAAGFGRGRYCANAQEEVELLKVNYSLSLVIGLGALMAIVVRVVPHKTEYLLLHLRNGRLVGSLAHQLSACHVLQYFRRSKTVALESASLCTIGVSHRMKAYSEVL